jgi:hypothetical protein
MGSKITGGLKIFSPTKDVKTTQPGYPLTTRKLKDYEEVCDQCNGLGLTKYDDDEFNCISSSYRCPKCFGYGKLDFIEKIVGKKLKYENETMKIDSSGNIGFGTTAPNCKLDIKQ